ncbi:hypothetical protein M9H77_21270 [Catharanthus roseus]|uniref:Uncharacterized protein n=1 Tax=Catharanthus roseus TaxID=4058 RepID=A0ACC0ALT2_CATRO|nr:hypothetical protein M9H77_21270 [Catharanthus roseus]
MEEFTRRSAGPGRVLMELIKSFLEAKVLGVDLKNLSIKNPAPYDFGSCKLRVWKKFNNIKMCHITHDYMTEEHVETTSSRQKMGTMRKREDCHTKFARDKQSFYHDGDNGVNAYGRNKCRSGNFTPKIHNRVDNFSSYAKSFGHTSYDNCGVLMIAMRGIMIVMPMVIIVMIEKFTTRTCLIKMSMGAYTKMSILSILNAK